MNLARCCASSRLGLSSYQYDLVVVVDEPQISSFDRADRFQPQAQRQPGVTIIGC